MNYNWYYFTKKKSLLCDRKYVTNYLRQREKEMATHGSIRAWRTPWTEEPGGLQSMGLQSWTRLSD